MATPVLATKLFVPRPPSNLVLRQRLIDQLSAVLQQKLILVSAPAGYGKTTLISSWLRETNIPFAWLSLDEDDNDPIRFFQYFITALQSIIPAVGEGLMNMPRGEQSVPFDTSINLLINEITDHADPFALVLDDFHLIHSQPVLDIVTVLLERMPPQMHLILLSRTDPPMPLARLRAHNQLVDIRVEQLRFTLDEITVFLKENMHLELSANDLALLETRTEGWIASLQLAALSMQHSQDIHAFITLFAGSHHYIMDYLVEEVLSVQSEKVRSFLLKTSILSSMCATLCNEVVDVNDREGDDGQELLKDLEQKNLFIIPLDEERQWYRYHHLFADMLKRRLEHSYPQQLPDLHLRASQWYEQTGLIPEAIQHSLAAGNLEHMIQLIEQNGCLLLMRGEVSTLQRWIEAVEVQTEARPWINIFKAWICTLTGNPEPVETLLQKAEKLISEHETSTGDSVMQGTIATARTYQANLLGETLLAAKHARQALEYLSGDDLVSRSLRVVAISLLGDASSMNGNLEEAKEVYRQAMQIAQTPTDPNLMIVLNSNIANILMEQGYLHDAYRMYFETLEMATRPDGQKLVIAGRLFAELGEISYEWNQLDAAMQQVQQSIALCQRWGNVDRQAIGYAMLARLEHVQHHPEKSQEAMRLAGRLLEEHKLLPKYSVWVKYIQTRLWIAKGDMEKASRMIEQSGISSVDNNIPYMREPEYLALVRVLLAKGNHEAALNLSQRMLEKAEVTSRTTRVIELLILQALIFQAKRDIDQALVMLGEALRLAKPEGYVRTFLDEGEPLSKLLHLAKARRIEMEYAGDLLALTGETIETMQPSVQLLAEPLSSREVEVLQLIESGCSNQEIATRLVISVATVKRHISNIYAKLGVQNRTQAVSIGRELRLLI